MKLFFFLGCLHVLIDIECFFFFKQKTAYELRICDWISDVCSSDLRVAFVTGAASGLGKASALMLARDGAKLMLFDRDAAGLEEIQALCPGAISYVGDASVAADVNAAAELSRQTFGPAEFLVASAGINGIPKPAIDYTEEEWDRLFDVNVKGAWRAGKEIGRDNV